MAMSRLHIFLTALIIILVILIINYHHVVCKRRELPCVEWEKLHFKTGDVVFTRYDYIRQEVFPLSYVGQNLLSYYLTGNVYTHSGTIIEYMGKPYLYHTGFYDFDIIQRKYVINRATITNLEEYLMKYRGDVIIYSIHEGLDTNKAIKFVRENFDRERVADISLLANTIYEFDENPNPSKIFCSQIIAEYLQYMNVLAPGNSYTYSPAKIASEIEKSGLYAEPVILNNPYHWKFHERDN